ncbi:STAS/SEC14 domain-containing protein [Geodermatophilus sp. SYSU D00525]
MIRRLTDVPDGVLGLEAVDDVEREDVEREDYENLVLPAIEQAIARHGEVRLVHVLGREFDDYEGGAVWEDLELGVRHPTAFERIAVVTDARWARPALTVFTVLWPGKARAFPLAERSAAVSWAAEEDD